MLIITPKVLSSSYYSNKSQGVRNKVEGCTEQEKKSTVLSPPTEEQRRYQKRWAELIQQVWEIDPLVCPLCSSPMRIISFIQDDDVIEKILKHLNLWEDKDNKSPPEEKEEITYERVEDEYAVNF